MKNKVNKYFRKLGFEVHGIGYIEKLKNSSIDKNEWNKQKQLLEGKAKTIFDVGANRGETALKYLSIFPMSTIHAFEPFPETCNIFNENHKNHKNVILNQVALSSKIGTAFLNVNSSVDTNSMLESSKLGATSDTSCKTVNQIEVETNTIDNYCKQNNIQEIDILKIDVQGFEIEVLKGALGLLGEGKIKLIYTESYFVQQYINQPLFYEIAAMLSGYDFVLQDIYDPYYSAKNILWCDAMFICKKAFQLKMYNSKNTVVSKLPDAGLGNKLFTWAHGAIFAHKNNLKHYSVGWTKIKIGPILRKETSLRFYRNYFISSVVFSRLKFFLLKNTRKTTIKTYLHCSQTEEILNDSIYIFNEIPHWSDYFKGIRENREIVLNTFFKSLSKKIHTEYIKKKEPVIGVHIRMGDFKKITATQNFSEVGHARTPMNYFVNTINQIRVSANKNLPVTIFSDGKKEELKEVLDLGNVALAEDDLDILQMLHLSKSKIIILSAGSTFGQWAAFLSDAAIINHYQHFNAYIRPNEFNKNNFEGVINPEINIDERLVEFIKKSLS